MKYTRPKLPYPTDGLEPIISARTVEFHYGKHEQTYIDTLNSLIEDTDFANLPIEEIITTSGGKLFNNASQAWNHIFYFFQFATEPQHEPHGRLRELIDNNYGSVENFKKEFENAGTNLFGSGWVWLSLDKDDTLVITAAGNAANPLCEGLKPLMVFDVWEHAYYLDYQNRRAEYLHRLWDILDWKAIEMRVDELMS